jgi:hypothetical protein
MGRISPHLLKELFALNKVAYYRKVEEMAYYLEYFFLYSPFDLEVTLIH